MFTYCEPWPVYRKATLRRWAAADEHAWRAASATSPVRPRKRLERLVVWPRSHPRRRSRSRPGRGAQRARAWGASCCGTGGRRSSGAATGCSGDVGFIRSAHDGRTTALGRCAVNRRAAAGLAASGTGAAQRRAGNDRFSLVRWRPARTPPARRGSWCHRTRTRRRRRANTGGRRGPVAQFGVDPERPSSPNRRWGWGP